MKNIVYLNGKYKPASEAMISPLDRGFLFADGVYEVIPVFAGRLLKADSHLQRFEDSMQGIRLENPHTLKEWRDILYALVEKNGGGDLSIYLQITRGAPTSRNHLFPDKVQYTIFSLVTPWSVIDPKLLEQGGKVILLDDYRWKKCQLKTVALLPNVLMRQEAKEAGAAEAILLRDGNVSECTTCNVFIVKNGLILTPPKSNLILSGITRELILELAAKHNMPCKESNITKAELLAADEVWISSSSKEVFPIVQIENHQVGNGKPSAVWKKMHEHFQAYKKQLMNQKVTN